MTYLMYGTTIAVLEEQFQFILDHQDDNQETKARFVAIQAILLAPFMEAQQSAAAVVAAA